MMTTTATGGCKTRRRRKSEFVFSLLNKSQTIKIRKYKSRENKSLLDTSSLLQKNSQSTSATIRFDFLIYQKEIVYEFETNTILIRYKTR